jgi:hypothetical protein
MQESWREILRINYKEFEPVDWELQWNEEDWRLLGCIALKMEAVNTS